MHHGHAARLVAVLALVPALATGADVASSSTPEAVVPILDVMGTLESARDPKCHATASRLEDFMYGTPLELEARVEKTRLQKAALRAAWAEATRASTGETVTLAELWPALQRLAPVQVPEWAKSNPPYSPTTDTLGDWSVGTADGPVVVTARDLRQYGSVAYGLRAILAVQQEELLDENSILPPLTPDAILAAKRHLDLMTLVALQSADREARALGARAVGPAVFRAAWNAAFEPAQKELIAALVPAKTSPPRAEPPDSPPTGRFATLRAVVKEKLQAYEKYNDLAMPVFLRNIQVYFARHRWPTDPAASEALRSAFNATLVAFTQDLLLEAERGARARGNPLIREDDVDRAADRYLPFEANSFEDIIYFPRLPRTDRVKIEAYDLDAFRDPGLHWIYLDTVLGDPAYTGTLEPDPFAAELLVEVVAQFGVLVLRTAGDVARETAEPRLSVASLEAGLRRIQVRIDRHAQLPPASTSDRASAVATRAENASGALVGFADLTATSGIAYSHRLSDWAARRIRSLQVTPDGTGRLAIPPAFGGSGVAAEDFDGDGDFDLLLLGGAGNRLYSNDGKGLFSDVTASSGVEWTRADNTPGEARQPIVADFDNDGRPDILITYLDDDHRIYRNLGGLRFADQTAGAGLGGAGLAGGPATAADFDRDGRVDVFIGYFGDWPRGVLPTLSRRSVNAQTDKIFRNVSGPGGALRFEDRTAGSGIENPGWAQSVGHVDFDRDGREDLIVGNDFGVNAYYRNLGEKPGEFRFEDRAAQLGVDKPSYTMNVGLTDWNRDGFPDVYISNIVMMNKDEKYVLPDENTPMKFDPKKLATMRVVETNDFWVSESDASGLAGYVQSPDVGRGKSSTGWAWDADFFDADNDGDDDLYVLDGMNEYAVYSSVHPYFADSPGLENVVVPVAMQEQNVFFENVAVGSKPAARRLEDATEKSGLGLVGNSRSAAYLDLENDGDLDIVVQAFLGDATVYQNQLMDQKKPAASGGPGGPRIDTAGTARRDTHWVGLRLEGDPARGTNRDAIGATLRIDSATHKGQWRQVTSTIGYLSVHPKTQHVGLGADTRADVTVRWPNGLEEVFAGLAADRTHVLRQGASTATAMTR